MSAGRKALRARRARLLERAGVERDELAGLLSTWERPLRAVDRGLAFLQGLKRGAPVIGIGIGVGMAALAFVRPRSLTGWFRGGQAAWRALTGGSPKAARRQAIPISERPASSG